MRRLTACTPRWLQALIRHHPDRQVRSGDGSIKSEVEAEEVFKLLVRLRDELREDEDAQVAVAM